MVPSEPPSSTAPMAEICHTAEMIAESEAVADAQMNATLAGAVQQPAARTASLVDSSKARADS
jgi:hypothetical protein